jgi:hypothetical protein
MPKRTTLTTLRKAGPLVVAVLSMAVLGAGIAQAQYYYGGRPPPPPPPQRGGGGFFPFFAPFQRPSAPFFGGQPATPTPDRPADFSRAPAPKKLETQPERQIVVLGDAMADWLAYGLEDAYSETQDLGVVRKHRTVSGLIRYQPRGAPEDWVAAAKDILANEKPSAVLIMLGLNDRQAIREPVAPVPAAKGAKPDANKPAAAQEAAKPETAKPESSEEQAAAEAAKSPDDDDEQPSIIAPERTTKGAGGMHEFRSEKWVELYKKKIADMIAVARTKGVPVLWVGLPAVRGQRAMSDVLLLNSLYREEASKAGITYIDVWDGFVDERGVFLSSGPDVEGQTRRLRAADNVYFTRAGARKLAHYAERELSRLVLNRVLPVALPSDPGMPDLSRPGAPVTRPLAGPIVPLTASSVGTSELLGGAGSRPANVDALAARTLVKGEPLAPPSGRADDFVWPRRDVGIPAPESIMAIPASAPQPASASIAPAAPAAPATPQRPRATSQQPNAAAQPLQPGQPSQPRPQRRPAANDGAPRPPAAVGPSAQAPARNWFGWR